MSHWIYKNNPLEDLPEDAFGFVYLITNLKTGKKYIGRKQSTKTISKIQKKKDGTVSKQRKRVKSESNWRTYTGSCSPLNVDIKKIGKENFKFEILAYAFTKGQLGYLEEHLQHKLGVIYGDYYNDAVGSGRHRGVKFTEEFIKILKDI